MVDSIRIMDVIDTAPMRAAQVNWSNGWSVRNRLGVLRDARRLVVARQSELCDAVAADIGREPGEVIGSDLLPLADALLFLERNAAKILAPRTIPRSQVPVWLWGERDTIYHRPLGLVGIIGTWNYPHFLNGVQIAHALAAGNAVLWKPSEIAPKSAEVLHQVFIDAGVPTDILVRLPATREAGPALAASDIDHVVFTGAAATGARLAKTLGERLIPSTLELSGCDGFIVLADADVPLAAKAAWFAVTTNSGQTCVSSRRAIVARSVEAEFVRLLRERFATAPPMRLATEAQARHAERLIADARSQGAEIVGGQILIGPGGTSMAPALILGAKPGMAVCSEDSFVPLLAVMSFDTLEEAIRLHNACPYGLFGTVFTNSMAQAEILAARIPVGGLAVNDAIVPVGHPATPFGGRGRSGWGVTHGAEGLLAMTSPQTVSVRGGSFRPHYDPFQPTTAALLGGMLKWKHAGSWSDRVRGFRQLLSAGRKLGR